MAENRECELCLTAFGYQLAEPKCLDRHHGEMAATGATSATSLTSKKYRMLSAVDMEEDFYRVTHSASEVLWPISFSTDCLW